MFRRFKYDVAFSFVQEDHSAVEEVAKEFKKIKGFNYYLYTEKEEEGIGQNIFKITREVYPQSRFVLIFTSKNFVSGFWARVEKMLMLAYIDKHVGRIIQVRLDDTPIDGLSKDIVSFKWKNDPERIAGVLIKKVLKQKAIERRRRVIVGCVISLVFAALIISNLPVIKSVIFPIRELRPVLIKGFMPDSPDSQSSYYINQTEVTVCEYRKYCDSLNQPMPPQPWPVISSNPVVNVSWQEAMAFCKARGGRLPTEMEWEYAAEANLQTKYAGGNNASKVAVYNRKRLSPVATKSANALGLYDMSGNVGEWTSSSAGQADSLKIIKGGGHRNGISALQITSRDSLQKNSFNKYTGFRVAWDYKP
ncbi:MAG: SUMF1/EgtB/PvdO family nonheme iron enzyme [Chitinophagaceae bacterium]